MCRLLKSLGLCKRNKVYVISGMIKVSKIKLGDLNGVRKFTGTCTRYRDGGKRMVKGNGGGEGIILLREHDVWYIFLHMYSGCLVHIPLNIPTSYKDIPTPYKVFVSTWITMGSLILMSSLI